MCLCRHLSSLNSCFGACCRHCPGLHEDGALGVDLLPQTCVSVHCSTARPAVPASACSSLSLMYRHGLHPKQCRCLWAAGGLVTEQHACSQPATGAHRAVQEGRRYPAPAAVGREEGERLAAGSQDAGCTPSWHQQPRAGRPHRQQGGPWLEPVPGQAHAYMHWACARNGPPAMHWQQPVSPRTHVLHRFQAPQLAETACCGRAAGPCCPAAFSACTCSVSSPTARCTQEQAAGRVAETWDRLQQASGARMVDVAAGIGGLLAVKDAAGLVQVKRAAQLAAGVVSEHVVPTLEGACAYKEIMHCA